MEFKEGVAYMPVPRCDQCAHWTRFIDGIADVIESRSTIGRCNLPIVKREDAKMWPEMYDGIHTDASFGCVEWVGKK